jgi:hypothetical protein
VIYEEKGEEIRRVKVQLKERGEKEQHRKETKKNQE